MKYMIHSCKDRLWYVEEYLVPSLIKQGINKDEIIIWNDNKGVGNLQSWLDSCKWISKNLKDEGVWHLQDDVLVCHDFKKRCEELGHEEIISGFCTYEFNKERYQMTYRVPIYSIWMTFPCIYIPIKYTNEFVFWFETKVIKDGCFKKEYKTGKMDDFFFNRYIKTMHPDIYCYQPRPNMVDHIDYLLGGSTINAKEHKKKINRAFYWDDEYLTKELEEKLKDRR